MHVPRLPFGVAITVARRHLGCCLLLSAGAALRLAVIFGYHQGFYYYSDSGDYLAGASTFVPHPARPFGYSLFLAVMRPIGPLWRVVALQHLAGLVLALTLYVFLYRRGVSRLVACLACAPLLLDARTIVVEHYVLSETLFTWLTVAAMLVVTRRKQPGWLAGATAAALFTAAALTRTAGLAILVLPLLYLLVRRVGWRAPCAFVLVTAFGIVGYASWYHERLGTYSLGTSSGRFLWSRTATFVDCDKLKLTAEERRLCPTQSRDRRLAPDMYLWDMKGPNMVMQGPEYDELFGRFARRAILAQPGDFAWSIAVDTLIFLRPDGGRIDSAGHSTHRVDCLAALWRIPNPGSVTLCNGYLVYGTTVQPDPGAPIATIRRWPIGPLVGYSRYCEVPTTFAGLALLLVLVLTIGSRRRSWARWPLPQTLDPLLWVFVGFGLIGAAVAGSAADPRYATPSIPLVAVAAALAWQAFRSSRRSEESPDSPDQIHGTETETGSEISAGPNQSNRDSGALPSTPVG